MEAGVIVQGREKLCPIVANGFLQTGFKVPLCVINRLKIMVLGWLQGGIKIGPVG